ncbi:MAG: AraC family transcriptional regulator [Arenicella sp.]
MQEQNNIVARITHLAEEPNAHSHLHHQIIFGLKGHAEFEISGIGGYVQKGVGCIVPSNHNHSFFGNRENKILILDITKNLPLLELETAFTNNALDSILDSPKYFQFDQRMHALLAALSNELETMVEDSAAPSIVGQCLLHSLYHRLRGEISVEEVSNVRNRIDLSRIKRYIYGNLAGKIQTADLARLCNLSESHFYQKFRESIGISPYQYVIDERIKAASTMIAESNKSITEICFTLGFSSQSAFTNVFRKKTGMSPTEFRQNSLN